MAVNGTDKDPGLTELTFCLGENSTPCRQANSEGPGAVKTRTGQEDG